MENLPIFLRIASELGLTPLNIALAGMLYFMGAHSGIFPKFWGDVNVKANLPASREQMERLSNYYNHDTTELLTEIRDGIGNVEEALTVMHANVGKGVADLTLAVSRLDNTLKEWEKYGVPQGNKK